MTTGSPRGETVLCLLGILVPESVRGKSRGFMSDSRGVGVGMVTVVGTMRMSGGKVQVGPGGCVAHHRRVTWGVGESVGWERVCWR